jgi:type VI secretion system protein ImpH
MAAHGWRSTRALSTQLREQFAGFDYYQLVRLLLAEAGSDAPERQALDRCVRFGADLSAAFPGREITRLEEPDNAPIRLGTSNYCVAGVLGPLPEPFSEWLRERVREGDDAMLRFLDLFNHRLNTLRYSLKSRFNPGLNNRHPEHTDNAGYLAAVMGLSQPGLAEQLPVPKRALLAVAGLLSDQRRSAAMIGQVLGLFMDAEVRVEQLAGGWAAIEPEQHTALGRANSRLGGETPLGRRFWDPQGRIVLHLGPLAYGRFCALLPGGALHAGFVALVRHLTDRQVDSLVCLTLDPATLPVRRLTAVSATGAGLRLGYTAWPQDTRPASIAALFARYLAHAVWPAPDSAAEGRLCLSLLLLMCLFGQQLAFAAGGSGARAADFLIRAYPAAGEVGHD